MTPFKDKYKQVIDSLYESTVSKNVKWKLDATGDPFVQIGNHKITLENREDADGSPYILVTINDLFDTYIESFSDNTLHDQKPSISGFATYWALMEELIDLARRQSRGADSALDDILQRLKGSK